MSVSTATSSFFFNDTATTEIYTLSLHDALPISAAVFQQLARQEIETPGRWDRHRSEEHTSELQSHSFISYAVFCLKKTRHGRMCRSSARGPGAARQSTRLTSR